MRRFAGIGAGLAAVGVALCGAALLADICLPPDLRKLEDVSTLVVDKDGRLLQGFTAADGSWRLATRPDDVDARYLRMLVAYEDKRFDGHPGIDPLAIGRALVQWAEHGRIVSGASTLTMQVARLLSPRPRTFGAKLVEMARALQIEWRYDKPRILSMYLTLAPFGGNLQGVRAASLFYFGKEPAQLTDGEAALLVALPQSPEGLRPDRRPAQARAARDRVLARMAAVGVLSPQAAAEARDQPVPTVRLPAVRHAPHLAERLRATAEESVVVSLIDGDLQRKLEASAERHQELLEAGATVAMLVVANADRAVRAYVGSGDFFDETRYGQNDMVRAVRSPGSALKPFIYGLAFHDLIVHPATMMSDRPMRFGDYAPENFDHHYRGEVSAREALQLSLNLPAVALLEEIGPTRFAARLAAAGTPLHLPDEVTAPGLPIALGGVGTSLQDLVTLYAALADGGNVRPLRFLADAPPDLTPGAPVRLMSATAAWYLTRILEEAPPPPSFVASQHRKSARSIAFKTGTSYGFRDAWAVGYDRDYTVGVWVGRPDGTFSPGRMGREAAGPILFEAFDMLPAPEGAAGGPDGPPADVIEVSNADLPLKLRRFAPRSAGVDAMRDAGPRIAFPADGAALQLAAADGRLRGLTMRADGGALPLLWLVNGAPLESSPYRRQAQWQPDGAGAARIIVFDSAGQSASVEIWIE